MKVKLLSALAVVLIAGIAYWILQNKKIEREVFAGLQLGIKINQYNKLLQQNDKFKHTDNNIYYYTFDYYGLRLRHFYGASAAYFNNDSIITKIIITLAQRESNLPYVLESQDKPNVLSTNLTYADEDDSYPSAQEMEIFLKEYYEAKKYGLKLAQVPIHVRGNSYTENRYFFPLMDSLNHLTNGIDNTGVNVTLSSIYDESISILDKRERFCQMTLTFEYTQAFMEKHNLYTKASDTQF